MKFPVSDTIRQFSDVFTDAGYRLYIVGGAVRDYLLGIENSDFDFCTDAMPDEVTSLFKHVIPTGIKHGTVTVLFKGNSFEVTTFRTEAGYSDRRHPDKVCFVSSLEEDLSRRDFTVNAFAADCNDGNIIDLFDGIGDLKAGRIRAIGDPHTRFTEDALRLLRMCRFASKLGFDVDETTFFCAKELCDTISFVSSERIFDELDKTLKSQDPARGLRLMHDSGLLEHIIPELEETSSVRQDKQVCSDVLSHIIESVRQSALRNAGISVRWALLLHDIAKPLCMKETDGKLSFYGHEIKGSEMARAVLRRLKASNALTDKACLLIENHMIRYESTWTDGAVKRFINRVGKENIEDLFALQFCDQAATEGKSHESEYSEFRQRIEKLSIEPLGIKDLAINGKDLIALGIPKNNRMGEILKLLLEEVLDDKSLNNREDLLKLAGLHMQA